MYRTIPGRRAFYFSCLSLCVYMALSSYDGGLIFNPQGKLLQVEYAKDAVKKGCPVIGIKCKDGLLIITSKRGLNSKFRIRKVEKMHIVEKHVCIAATGLLFDAQVLVDVSKKICNRYRSSYMTPIPVMKLASDLAQIVHRTTMITNNRPIGASLLIAGWDDFLGPQLYRTDPEGSFESWTAVCIGHGSEAIWKSLLEIEKELHDASLVEAWKHLEQILLKHFFDEESDQMIHQKFDYDHGVADSFAKAESTETVKNYNEWEFEVCTGMLSSENELTWSVSRLTY